MPGNGSGAGASGIYNDLLGGVTPAMGFIWGSLRLSFRGEKAPDDGAKVGSVITTVGLHPALPGRVGTATRSLPDAKKSAGSHTNYRWRQYFYECAHNV